MKTVFIYSLHCPKTGQLRYIGKTKDPTYRMRKHLERCHKKSNYRECWLHSLQRSGLRPILMVVEEVPESEWELQEKKYIARARELGFLLVNATDGGEGLSNPSAEIRKKMGIPSLGRKLSLAHRANISAGLRGRVQSQTTRDKIGQAQVGEKNHMFGKPSAQLGRSGILHPSFGKKQSAATQLKKKITKCFSLVLRLCQPIE